MELRVRPKSDYLHRASWSELYTLAKHWQSDMDFYRDEIRFLYRLTDKYFIWLIRDENLGHVQASTSQLSEAEAQQKELIQKINQHLGHLARLMESTLSHDEQQQFRGEHARLENLITDFAQSFKELKKEVFAITEHVIEEEKLKRLLTP